MIKRNQTEKNWKILFNQIVLGNVIPVIGPDFVELGGTSVTNKIIELFCDDCGIDDEISTFSQLVSNEKFKQEFPDNDIHELLTDNIDYFVSASARKTDNMLLRRFLSIPYFPFVITTLFDPIVENIMREIHGDKLRTLCFRNTPGKNDDISNGCDTKSPCLYYMFGKADGKSESFVVTDIDMLRFARTWMQPNDRSINMKPSKLSDVLSERYLLVLGHNYQDWLFRFFWYAMKDDAITVKVPKDPITKKPIPGGMLAQNKEDHNLIDFLYRANAFPQVEPNMEKFINKLQTGILESEKELNIVEIRKNMIPIDGTDVFISYSRGDKTIVEELYDVFTSKGLKVWYDKESLHKGLDFMVQIESAIKHSTFFVPVFTNTIITQANEEHPYRLEWLYAVEHIRLTGGVTYNFPFLEESFNIDSPIAAIYQELKRHDTFTFTKENVRSMAEKMADCLLLEKKNKNG